jgi:hypothetical protein
MHKKIVIFLSGKNTPNQSGLATGSDWCLAGEKRALYGVRLEKSPIRAYFLKTDNFIVPPKLGGILGIGK